MNRRQRADQFESRNTTTDDGLLAVVGRRSSLPNTMSISPIVDEHYRLRPSDIGRGSIQVTVQNVSWQGVEQLHPLLHLREFPQKRLLLNQPQVQSITEIVGSTLAQDWIGHRLVLAVQYQSGEPVITLHSAAPTNPEPTAWRPALHLSERARTLLLLLLLALLFALVFLLDNANALGQ